jgi:hypothetical protein
MNDCRSIMSCGMSYERLQEDVAVGLRNEAEDRHQWPRRYPSLPARPSQSAAKASAILAWFERYRTAAPGDAAAAAQ